MAERVRGEGETIQKYLSRPSGTPMTDVIHGFSVETFQSDLKELAPTIWKLLLNSSAKTDRQVRRNKELVFVSICAMISMLRSQKANNFQVVIGFFLLGSGASKREIEVIHHAGLSISYNSIIDHIQLLAAENLERLQTVVKEYTCSIVWDNIKMTRYFIRYLA
ncbi:hypothetical protein K435DRAFT_663322 [Dendrothele bispora CBS 962.96]|uniref:Uncharacterized protein n=1 Tax=Dendrothele bispora (strain CBS 962.96) TaxID=1314807 RepID=A0A4S8M4U0_DENBC|nr:hypothetical protein K435DRAFT_663322 [Dendrothele bispora CBS 962.96]